MVKIPSYEELRDRTVADLSRKYGHGNDPVRVAVGIRPSGTIHLGNMSSITLAGILATDIGPHRAEVDLTVCDLDLPDYTDWDIKETGFVRYFRDLPDEKGCHGNLLDHSMDGITSFARHLEEEVGVKFNLKKLSEVQRDPRYRRGLIRVLDTPEAMQMILPDKVKPGQVLAFPLCPDCHTSNPRRADYDSKRRIITTTCINDGCTRGEYETDVEDTERDIAVHFFIDPLRDGVIDPPINIHVFGGDYRYKHATNKPPLRKVEKILQIMGMASDGPVPDVLMGPIFYARDGEVMSKRDNNGLLLDVLQRHFGDDCVKKVVSLMRQIIGKDLKNVDYSIVDESLFGEKST